MFIRTLTEILCIYKLQKLVTKVSHEQFDRWLYECALWVRAHGVGVLNGLKWVVVQMINFSNDTTLAWLRKWQFCPETQQANKSKDLALHNLTSIPSTTSHYKIKLDYSIIKKLQEETKPYVMKMMKYTGKLQIRNGAHLQTHTFGSTLTFLEALMVTY